MGGDGRGQVDGSTGGDSGANWGGTLNVFTPKIRTYRSKLAAQAGKTKRQNKARAKAKAGRKARKKARR